MTLVICPECEAEVELEKRYCPNCTAPIPPNAMPATDRTVPVNSTIRTGRRNPTQLVSVARKSRTLAIVVALASVVVIFAVVGIVIYQSHRQDTANAISTPINLTPNGGGQQRVVVPVDAKLYLTFLQGIEQSRADLRSGLGAATANLTPVPPSPPLATTGSQATPEAAQPPAPGVTSAPAPAPGASPTATPVPAGQPASPGSPAPSPAPAASSSPPPVQAAAPNPAFAAYTKKWQDLIKEFSAEPPPANCQVLNNDYYRLLQDYSSMLDDLAALQSPTTDSVSQAEQANVSKIREDALVADNALKSLCDGFGVNKPFSIDADLVPASPTPAK